jgi:hypothetical protein
MAAVHAIAGDLGQGVVRFSTVLVYILPVSYTQQGNTWCKQVPDCGRYVQQCTEGARAYMFSECAVLRLLWPLQTSLPQLP